MTMPNVANGAFKLEEFPPYRLAVAASDGRGRRLRLTRKGAAVYRGMVPLACELEGQLAEGLSRSQWTGLLKALDRLDAHVRVVQAHDNGAAAD